MGPLDSIISAWEWEKFPKIYVLLVSFLKLLCMVFYSVTQWKYESGRRVK